VQRVLITGGGGFIGSNLADRLLADGLQVVVYDNFSTGRHEFLEGVLTHSYGDVVKGDVLDGKALRSALDGCDTVFHLQANADVRHGLEQPRRDREPDLVPTPEDAPMPIQTSLYGTCKVAGEGTLHAYCHGFGFTGVAFRFVSILGERYSHGQVIDFYRGLRAGPTRLRLLGDGRQRKSYLYIGDCVEGMLTAMAAHTDPGDAAVWPGDSPLILLDCAILRALGCSPTLPIDQAIVRTVDWLEANG
jgi:UDP-glucose 4-epimerase